jgi:hypothetical protein
VHPTLLCATRFADYAESAADCMRVYHRPLRHTN